MHRGAVLGNTHVPGRLSGFIVGVIALIPAVIIAFVVLYPVGRIFFLTFLGRYAQAGNPLFAVVQQPWFLDAVGDTLLIVAVAGALAIVFASVFAWFNERTDASLGLLGDILPLVPLLMPTVALSIGWVFLATPGPGFLNGFLNLALGGLGIQAQLNIVSYPGIIFLYTLSFIPYVYVLVAASLRNVDPALEEASRLSGVGPVGTMLRITLPAIKPALLSSVLLLFIIGISLYSVPIIIASRAGIDILSVRIVRAITFAYPPRLDQALSLSVMLFMVIGPLWWAQKFLIGKGHFAVIGGRRAHAALVRLGHWKGVARASMILFLLLTSVLPLFALLVVSLQPFWQATISPSRFVLSNFKRVFVDNQLTRDAVKFSLLLATSGALISLIMTVAMGVYARWHRNTFARIVGIIPMLPGALSHIVIGVALLVSFGGPPFNFSGTLAILLLAYIVIFLPEAAIATNNALSYVGEDLVEASSMSGASKARALVKIVLPLMGPGLISGWSLLFVLMAGELTASSMLAGARSPVIGFAILDIWEAGTPGPLAAIACGFTLLTSTVILASTLLSRRMFRVGGARR